MDEEIFPVLCPKKTYSKPFRKMTKPTPESNNVEKVLKQSKKTYDPGVPLTTKVAVEYLLNGKLKTSVCRYCLKVTVGLSELDQILQIAGTGVMYKVSIREMIACFYPFKARQEENFPEKICQSCIDRALNAYLFTQQCEQAERALHNCFDDMNEKINKLDPVDRPKKRGRQKLKPNFNVLYAEHGKVMDYAEPIRNIINSQTESLSKEPDWNEFECKRCWQVLPDLESLMNHEQKHPKHMWYHCRLCGKSFVKLNQLKKHFTQVHIRGKGDNEEVDKTYKCKECGNITENHVQHLQHIEKHKFKSIMKHLIEKKTDQLCLVCLKNSTDLVELDKMVCIHGSCPELVGDKSLYTVLASTLPDQKSYKYQELHVPRKADIMTITKRKRKFKEIQNIPHFIPGIQYKLSLPKIITKDKFKTDDFYYYVFCEPFEVDNHNVISTINLNISTQDTISTRIFETTDEETMDCNLDDNMLTNAKNGICVIGHSSNGNKIPGDIKEIVNPVIEMDMEETGPLDSFKSIVNNDINQIKLPRNAKPDGKNVTGHIESEDFIIKSYPTAKVLTDNKQKQTIDLTGPSNVKDNIPSIIKEAMNVVGHCAPEVYRLNVVREPTDFTEKENPVDTIILDEKYPTELFKSNNLEDSTPNIFNFSNPIAVEHYDNLTNRNLKLDANMASLFIFSNPDDGSNKSSDQELHNSKLIKQSDILECDVRPIKVKTDLSWIFTKASDKYTSVKDNEVTDNVTNVIGKTKTNLDDCIFCWLFKHLNKCEYCQKSSDKSDKIIDEDKQNKEKSTVLDNGTNKNSEKPIDIATFLDKNVEIQPKPVNIEKYDNNPNIKKIWQCNVCLTNNNKDRSTCHCCESRKYIENGNCKVTFGNNKTFFITKHEKENKEESDMEKEVDKSNKDTIRFTIDEATLMDTKSGTMQENIEIQIDNIKDINSTHSMDIETVSVNYNLDTKATIEEEMDVEEEPFIPNTVQKFDLTPTNTLAANIVPFVGTNIQFNIGSNSIQNKKGARIIKKAVRNMPKAFHK